MLDYYALEKIVENSEIDGSECVISPKILRELIGNSRNWEELCEAQNKMLQLLMLKKSEEQCKK